MGRVTRPLVDHERMDMPQAIAVAALDLQPLRLGLNQEASCLRLFSHMSSPIGELAMRLL